MFHMILYVLGWPRPGVVSGLPTFLTFGASNSPGRPLAGHTHVSSPLDSESMHMYLPMHLRSSPRTVDLVHYVAPPDLPLQNFSFHASDIGPGIIETQAGVLQLRGEEPV